MSDKTILQHLKDNWIIYLFVGNIIYSTAITGSRLNAVETRTDMLEAYQRQEQVTLTEIKTRLASIDTNIEYLRKDK